MTMNPKSDDAVLGGQQHPASDVAVLGGIKAQQLHDQLPISDFLQESVSAEELNRDKQQTHDKGFELGVFLKALVEKQFSEPDKEKAINYFSNILNSLAIKGRIFPDMGQNSIWYTDHLLIINSALQLGLGDTSLPHWPEESNEHRRYLELTAPELLISIFSLPSESLSKL